MTDREINNEISKLSDEIRRRRDRISDLYEEKRHRSDAKQAAKRQRLRARLSLYDADDSRFGHSSSK
jgi:hypothetical protein